MAYWIQLKGVFDLNGVPYPLIQQRNSLLLIDGGTAKRIEKLGWETERFFEPKEKLRKDYLLENDAEQLDFSAIQQEFQALRLSLITKAKEVDSSLESFAEAETVRMSKQLEMIEQRLVKQVKQQHEQALKSIDAVCDRFMPENELQERYFHWLNFAASGDYSSLLVQIHEAIDPFEDGLIVVELK
jgi:bacillithiol synthase